MKQKQQQTQPTNQTNQNKLKKIVQLFEDLLSRRSASLPQAGFMFYKLIQTCQYFVLVFLYTYWIF